MRIDLLDVGTTKYGDCILVRHKAKVILIDGAHPGDTERIGSQLETLLGHAPPFEVDLLIVTHCHSDHIGCLPALVGSGDLRATTALVADEKLGWGSGADGHDGVDAMGLSDAQRILIAALQEEDHSDLPSADLQAFLEDAASLEQKYIDMLRQLAGQGTKVVRYGRSPHAEIGKIEAQFADLGLKILGPTSAHLKLCADAIAQGTDALADAIAETVPADADSSDQTAAYRRLVERRDSDVAVLSDRPGIGAAKNDQSIVLRVEAGGWSALLAGDMQFAKPEVSGLNPLMRQLRQDVLDAGPYTFIKLTHHASYNGMDETVLSQWSTTKLFAHTGGRNDADHPDHGVLDLLKSHKAELTFARTDRNGLITVAKNGSVKMVGSKGRLNDFTPNQSPDQPERSERPPEPLVARPERPSIAPGVTGRDEVEVVVRIPHRQTRVTLSIGIEPQGESRGNGHVDPQPPAPGPPVGPTSTIDLRLGGGRDLGKLLFVTSRARLEANIGSAETAAVFAALGKNRSVKVVDLPSAVTTVESAASLVRNELNSGAFDGTVILGGYDVVPAERLDVLDAALRGELAAAGLDDQDADNFIVWSDDLYGDRDGDDLPELPVSRIPDGRRADVVLSALQAPRFQPGRRFGVRNTHRPFATTVFSSLPGNGGNLEVSEHFAPHNVVSGAASGATYFMLHGSARDAARFWGETQGGAAYEAIAVENVPEDATGTVVFTGCCWGALPMSPPAAQWRPTTPLRPRGPEASMAMAYLKAGALAFVGCTGSHYSPNEAPYDFYGKPMHEAFWKAIVAGQPPSRALYSAKGEFAKRMPHGRTDPFSRAVEMKLLRQFSCLGLGW